MKKYLSLLLVALFATLSFTLTSCGDDNDEPNGGDDKASLTINGQGYKEHSYAASTLTDYGTRLGIKIEAELYPAKSDESDFYPRAHISIEAKSETLTKGMTLTLNDGYVEMITDVMAGDKYDEIKSGKITVSEVKGSTVTLNFDNLKLADDDDKTVTINGSLVCDYDKI